MSTTGQNVQQLQQEIQHELITVNQLLHLISIELDLIKNFTSPGGELESNIKHNASLMSTLASLQHLDLDNIPPMLRRLGNMNNTNVSQNIESTRSETAMDDSQVTLS